MFSRLRNLENFNTVDENKFAKARAGGRVLFVLINLQRYSRAGKRKISSSRAVSRFYYFKMEIDIGQRIRQKLADDGRSIAWLAEKVNCNRSNMWKILQCKHIHSELLYEISVVLKEDFFALYSLKVAETLTL